MGPPEGDRVLFNSYAFLLVFLPITLLAFGLARRFGYRALSLGVLAVASFAFYGYWRTDHLVIFIITVIANYHLGIHIAKGGNSARVLTTIGVVANLGVLFGFKYTGFVLENVSGLLGKPPPLWNVVLPIGISFYTFQQVAYLVDCFKTREPETRFREYALFVSFFPQLIAGPIVHHSVTRPQFAALRSGPMNTRFVGMGLALLVLGLAKKVLVADNLAGYSDPIFQAADAGISLDSETAWIGALIYTLQIYYDFSGYSDIAIGLGLLFGIRLPINFNSPYKATSIIDFWRRWHITLSTWLRDYLYIPLGGNKHGEATRLRNVFLTMLIGGFWHGAGWTFVVWGALHGSYITVNHLLRKFFPRAPKPDPNWDPLRRLGTLFLVVVAWVFFRATTMSGALGIVGPMFGFADSKTPFAPVVDPTAFPWLAGAALAVLFAPNPAEIVGYTKMDPTHPEKFQADWSAFRALQLSPGTGAGLGLLLALVLASVWRPTVFIYFNF